MTFSDPTENAVRPVYPVDVDERQIVLYSGPLTARLRSDELTREFNGEGRILFRLAPEPLIPWQVIAAPSNLPNVAEQIIVEELVIPEFSRLSFPDPFGEHSIAGISSTGERYVEFGGSLGSTEIGDPESISELRYHLIGFPLQLGNTLVSYPDGIRRPGRVSFSVNGWVVDIDIWFDVCRLQHCAPGALPYKYIRTCRVRRHDNIPFSGIADDIKFLRIALSSFLSFVTGRLVGIALPVGIDEIGNPKYVEWSSTIFDSVSDFKSWYPEAEPGCLEDLFAQFVSRLQEPLWQTSLMEAIRLYVAANALWKDFAVGVITACAALESLTWTILVQETGVINLNEYRSRSAAERLRMLLEWAEVPSEVPTRMQALGDLASQKNMDAPGIVCWIRNRVAHPDKKSELQYESVHDSWTVSLWYLELILLRLLRFDGVYKSRVNPSPTIMALEQVPWRDETSSAQAAERPR